MSSLSHLQKVRSNSWTKSFIPRHQVTYPNLIYTYFHICSFWLPKYNLEYHELRSIVTKHSQIPSKLLCFVVSQKKLDHTCSLDLRKNNVVNVYVQACGGADNVNDNESIIQVCAICDSKNSIKYYHMNGWSATKIKAALYLRKMTKFVANVKEQLHAN